MLTQLTPTTSMIYLFGAYVLIGLGMGLFNPPITNTAVSGMPPSMAGVAAAVASTARQGGSTLGVAVFGVLAGSRGIAGVSAGFAAATHAGMVGRGRDRGDAVRGRVRDHDPWARRTAERAAEADRGGDLRAAPRAPTRRLVAH